MPLPLELGQVSDVFARRALEQISLRWPYPVDLSGIDSGGTVDERWDFTVPGWSTQFDVYDGDAATSAAVPGGEIVQQADGIQFTGSRAYMMVPRALKLDNSTQTVEVICGSTGQYGAMARIEDTGSLAWRTQLICVVYDNDFMDVARQVNGAYTFRTNGSNVANWTAGARRWLRMVTFGNIVRSEVWTTDPEAVSATKAAVHILEWTYTYVSDPLFVVGQRPRAVAARFGYPVGAGARLCSYRVRGVL